MGVVNEVNEGLTAPGARQDSPSSSSSSLPAAASSCSLRQSSASSPSGSAPGRRRSFLRSRFRRELCRKGQNLVNPLLNYPFHCLPR